MLHIVQEDISNKPSFRQEHQGVSDGPDGSDGTSYGLTENQTRPVAEATGRIAYLPSRQPLYHASYSCDHWRCILGSPPRRQASFTMRPDCSDVYAPSERHRSYTLHRAPLTL
jgi:hypothetical protein